MEAALCFLSAEAETEGDVDSLRKEYSMWSFPFWNWESKFFREQYKNLENHQGQRGWEGCSPWGCKQSNTTEQLSIAYT